MNFKVHITLRTVFIFLFLTLAQYQARASAPSDDNSSWYIKPSLGLSNLSDTDGTFESLAGGSGNAVVSVDSGFVSGLTLGYRYPNSWSAELGWEYRTNDSTTTLPNGARFEEGNYASNIFFVNGVYDFQSDGGWSPYVGGGIVWVQEIDIDLENGDEELSFSESGNLGFQVFAGLNRKINERWSADIELKYGNISGIDLEAEPGTMGTLSGLDYSKTTLQAGLRYTF